MIARSSLQTRQGDPVVKYALECWRIINDVLTEYDAGAIILDPWQGDAMQIAASSHVSFKPSLRRGVTEKQVVAKAHDMIMSRLTSATGEQVHVRAQMNALHFEVPIPSGLRKPLLVTADALTGLQGHAVLLGRHYQNGRAPAELTINLCNPDTAHILNVGMTGSGKSVLMQTMATSLAWTTSPRAVRYFIIDLKNEDLMPFRLLPHCEAYAGDIDEAAELIEHIYQEKEARRADPRRRQPRIVLWIDEIGQIAEHRESIEKLNNVIMVARSFGINIVAATQRATEKGGIGRMMNANFGVRNVGLVSDASEAAIATGRPQTDAHLLPGYGSFLRRQGSKVIRFQSYWLGDAAPDSSVGDEGQMVRDICKKWGQDGSGSGAGRAGMARDGAQDRAGWGGTGRGMAQDRVQDLVEMAPILTAAAESERDAPLSRAPRSFPLNQFDELSIAEKQVVRQMASDPHYWYRGDLSMQRLATAVFGSSDMARKNYLREVLDEVEL